MRQMVLLAPIVKEPGKFRAVIRLDALDPKRSHSKDLAEEIMLFSCTETINIILA